MKLDEKLKTALNENRLLILARKCCRRSRPPKEQAMADALTALIAAIASR